MSYTWFHPLNVQDLHEWLHIQDYKDKDTLKYYILPMIKFYSIKFKDIINEYVSVYSIELGYSEYKDTYGTNDKIIQQYIIRKSKK